jgi:hypothetical protein
MRFIVILINRCEDVIRQSEALLQCSEYVRIENIEFQYQFSYCCCYCYYRCCCYCYYYYCCYCRCFQWSQLLLNNHYIANFLPYIFYKSFSIFNFYAFRCEPVRRPKIKFYWNFLVHCSNFLDCKTIVSCSYSHRKFNYMAGIKLF